MEAQNFRADHSKAKTIALILISTLLIIVSGMLVYYVYFRDDQGAVETPTVNSFEECVAAGNPVMESYPRQCSADGKTFVEELTGPVEYESPKGVRIELNDFQSGEPIESPLTLTGRVPGNWSFEADFPIVLTDWDGRVIAESIGRITEDWMTEELVNFEVTLEFEKPGYKDNGALILRKDNPSGLPEHDDAVEIPVVFK